MNKTFFIDIDGTLIKHKNNLFDMITQKPEIIQNTIEVLSAIRNNGHMIILTTARPEGTRLATENQLCSLGIFYDKLIMGLNTGPRIVVNDTKPDGTITAIARPLIRDDGILELKKDGLCE